MPVTVNEIDQTNNCAKGFDHVEKSLYLRVNDLGCGVERLFREGGENRCSAEPETPCKLAIDYGTMNENVLLYANECLIEPAA